MKQSPPKRVAIILKHNSQKALKEAKELKKWLSSRKIESFFQKDISDKLTGKPLTEGSGMFADIDLIISLGGDGTLLSVVKNVLNHNVPILGVNMGSLGFLTEISLKNMYPSLERVLKGDLPISPRTTLSAKINHKGKSSTYFVLNDVVINKRALARIIELELTINDMLVTTYKSDGLIISTPTGSTAYSLSAGGPIIYPNVDCMIVSPICSHTLTHRPIIVPANSVIKVKLTSKSDDVQLTLDGQVGDNLEYLNEVVIKKSKKRIRLIESFEKNYFEILRTKLHWGKRGSK
jgi:NAD+ kinase